MTKKQQLILVSWWRVWGVGCSINFLVLFLVPFLVVLVLYCNKETVLLRDGFLISSSKEKHEILLCPCKEIQAASEEIHGTLLSSAKENREELITPLEHNHGALPLSHSEGNHGAVVLSYAGENCGAFLISPPKEDHAAPINSSQGNQEAIPNSSEGNDHAALLSSLVGKQGPPLISSLRGNHAELLINSSVQNGGAILTPSVENLRNSSVQYHGSLVSSCDMSSGTWVYDNKSPPLYKDWSCSFMYDDLACEKYGRMDLNYQYWRWQPDNCDLPKYVPFPSSLSLPHRVHTCKYNKRTKSIQKFDTKCKIMKI